MSRVGGLLASVTACVGSLAPRFADAQDAQPEDIDELIVTATRRETALRDTPLSVSALTGADLQSIGARDIVDYFEHVPGLAYNEDAFGGYRITIRGIAAGTFVESRPLTAFYLDATPMMTVASGAIGNPQWGGARPLAIDVERVEVLRGPQGTLFGASALGGAVRMLTYPPNTDRRSGSAEAMYSTTAHGGDNYAISGVLNAPLLEDRLALRAVGYRRSDGGYVDNVESADADVNETTFSGARLALLWNAAENIAVTFRAYGQDRKSGGLAAADVAAGEYQQIRHVTERDDEHWDLFTLAVDYQLPRAHLELMTSRLTREPDFAIDVSRFVERFVGIFNPTANQFRDSVEDTVHELRIASETSGPLSWLAGTYYQQQNRAWTQDQLSPGFDALTGAQAASYGYPDVLYHAVYSGTLRQNALYGELSYDVTPALQLTVGARWFNFEYDTDNFSDGLFAGGPSYLRASATEDGVTPKLGLAFRASARTLLFANVTDGFRPGGINEYTDQQVANCAPSLAGLGIDVPPRRGFESDSLRNIELGARTGWLGERLLASASLYHISWKDMQTPRTIACPNSVMNIIENVGKTRSDGVELEMTWRPKEMLDLTFGVAHADTHLATASPSVAGEIGEPIPTVPERTLSVSINAEFQLAGRARGFARADYRYVDDSWSDFDENLRRRTPARHVLDVRFGTLIDNWRIELFAENALDERGVLLHTNNVVGEWQVLMLPRTVGVQARVAF